MWDETDPLHHLTIALQKSTNVLPDQAGVEKSLDAAR